MKLRFKLLGLGILLLIEAIVIKGCPKGIVKNPSSNSKVLPLGTTEQIVVDPVKHQLLITTSKGTTTQTLPDRKSVFDIQKNGDIKIISPQFGYEVRPYLGLGAESGIRFYLGTDLLYWKKLDLGLGIGLPPISKSNWQVGDIRPLVNVGYVIWDNASINLGLDTSKQIHGFVSLRI